MLLQGSCHCKAVTFSVESTHPYPFNHCYCSVCRKTSGSGGYAINLGAQFDTMIIQGEENIRSYNAVINDPDTGEVRESPAERKFCGTCGSALWLWDPRWPDLVHPHASAIDTDLPVPPERTHLMVASKANWVQPVVGTKDKVFDQYPDESIAEWHDRLVLKK